MWSYVPVSRRAATVAEEIRSVTATVVIESNKRTTTHVIGCDTVTDLRDRMLDLIGELEIQEPPC